MRMRFLCMLFLFVTSIPAMSQSGFTSLDELQVKHFNSKRKYPATVLRNEPEAYYDIVSVEILKGKKYFTGTVADSGSSAIVRMEVSSGQVVELFHREPNDDRREHYAYKGSVDAGFHATDTVWYGAVIFQTSQFYDDSTGKRYQYQIEYNNGWETRRTFRIGFLDGESMEYCEPAEEGKFVTYFNGELMSSETYHNGHIDGEVSFYDEKNRLLQRYFVNAAIGTYGSYYEFDTTAQTVTTGMYNIHGYETGVWTSKYTDSSVAALVWMSGQGSYDSAKTYDRQGQLSSVNYSYRRMNSERGFTELISYTKSWYANGQLASWNNNDPLFSDTICARYSETGKPLLIEYYHNHRRVTKTWYENGRPKSERYGVVYDNEEHTLRDSIYREWSPDGILQKEHFYARGKFISSNDAPQTTKTNSPDRTRSAYSTLMQNTSYVATWDSAVNVPAEVVEKMSMQLNMLLATCNLSGDKTLRVDAMSALEQNFAVCASPTDTSGYWLYSLKLNKQKDVAIDSTGKICTGNNALNLFLDSLRIKAETLSRAGDKKRRNTYWLSCSTSDQYLNLHYINRRLASLAPGSEMSLYKSPVSGIPAEIIYTPADTSAAFGKSTVTTIAIAGNGRSSTSTAAQRNDVRPFYVFNIYADGEVEFSHVTSRKELLLQLSGSMR